MGQYALKVLISSILLVVASEVGKRSALLGAVLISLPLSSILALSFLYFDTREPQKVIDLSWGILLMILPSLAFFGFLIALLKLRQPYWLALVASCIGMALVFAGYSKVMQWMGWME